MLKLRQMVRSFQPSSTRLSGVALNLSFGRGESAIRQQGWCKKWNTRATLLQTIYADHRYFSFKCDGCPVFGPANDSLWKKCIGSDLLLLDAWPCDFCWQIFTLTTRSSCSMSSSTASCIVSKTHRWIHSNSYYFAPSFTVRGLLVWGCITIYDNAAAKEERKSDE